MTKDHPHSYNGRRELARKKAKLRKVGRALVTVLYVATFALIGLAVYRG